MRDTVGRLRGLIDELAWSLTLLQQNLSDKASDKRFPDEVASFLGSAQSLLQTIQDDDLAKLRHTADEIEGLAYQSQVDRTLMKLASVYFRFPMVDHFLDAMLDDLMAETASERAVLALCEQTPQEIRIIAARGFQSKDLNSYEHALSRATIAKAIERGESIVIADAASDERFSLETSVLDHHARSVLVTPLQCGSRIFGAIYMGDDRKPSAYSQGEKKFLESIAQVIAGYLEAMHRLDTAIRAKEQAAVTAPEEDPMAGVVGCSQSLKRILQTVEQIADSAAPVLIEGEPGTGKQLIARTIHRCSARRARPFVVINCAVIPHMLIESEFFGHARGTVAGEPAPKPGRLERADGGTIFLQEIVALPPLIQAKFLRFLQTREFAPPGSDKPLRVDVRVIVATSLDLEKRIPMDPTLGIIRIKMPALRERREDIPLLADHFLKRFTRGTPHEGMSFESEALRALAAYNFPGNISELENLVRHLALLSHGTKITIDDLPDFIAGHTREAMELEKSLLRKFLYTVPENKEELDQIREAIIKMATAYAEKLEEEFIKKFLERAKGNITEASRLSGMTRGVIYVKTKHMKKEGTPIKWKIENDH